MEQPQRLFDTYRRAPLRFERGEGAWLTTISGERYLDFAAGIAVNSLGHCHPHVVEALKTQADKLWHVSNLYEVPGQEVLAARLTDASFAEKVFFANSGAEAVECAIKTARRYHFAKGRPERYQVLTFDGAFHGRTIATVAAGGNEKYIEGFGPKAPGFVKLPFGDLQAVRESIGAETAAILLEPIQGEGGVRSAQTDFLRGLRSLCDQNDLLLVFDEVQCGLGRTGKLFAYQWTDIQPDIMAVAKGIGGGFPVGACLATAQAAAGMELGTHGSTYGGNPLAMAVANAVLDIVLGDGFLDGVLRVADKLDAGLRSMAERFPTVIDRISGKGLMLGIRSVGRCSDLVEAIRMEKMLVVAAGNNSIRLLPPLIVTETEASDALGRLQRAAERLI